MKCCGPCIKTIPEGDDKPRLTCADCGYIDYQNPKPTAHSVAIYDDKILLVRRAIEPRTGFWCLPGGHQEKGEPLKTTAIREAFEEAAAVIAPDELLAVYEVPAANITLTIYRARLLHPYIAPGNESQEVRLFDWQDIPWADLAFPMVANALHFYKKTQDRTDFAPDQQVLARPAP